MKLYCKIKKDGKWNWYSGDSPWKIHIAKQLCECRVCRPNIVRQEEVSHVGHIVHVDAAGNQTCLTCGEEEE